MKKKTWLKLLTALFIVVGIIVYFNWGLVSTGTATLNQYTLILVIFVLLLIPVGLLAGDWLDSYAKSKRMGLFSKTGKAKKPEDREKAAREELNKHRRTDSYLSSNSDLEMEVVMRESSPFRQDAVQLEMFAFTTSKQKPHWNPLLDADGIPAEYIFYVLVNCHTCEAFFNRYKNSKEAVNELNRIWLLGIKKIEATEIEKKMGEAAIQGLGIGMGMKAQEEKKDEGGKE